MGSTLRKVHGYIEKYPLLPVMGLLTLLRFVNRDTQAGGPLGLSPCVPSRET